MAIRGLVRQFPGMRPLYLRFRTIDGRELRLKADAEYSVGDEEAFKEKLAEAARVIQSQISLLGYRLRAVNHDLRRIYFLGKDLIQVSFPAMRDCVLD